MYPKYWTTNGQGNDPCDDDYHGRVANGSPRNTFDRIHHGQVSVQGEEDKSDDGPVTCDVIDVLEQAAKYITKGPIPCVRNRRRWNANGDKK